MGKKPYSRVYLEVTNVCNKDCSFCIGTKRAPRNMTLAEVDIITDKLLPFTDYIYFHLMGEPLLHKDIFDMISLATKKGFKCAITTNGSLLEKHGNALIGSGAYKVNISLHSFEGASEDEHIAYLSSCIDFVKAASDAGVLCVFRLWNGEFERENNLRALSLLRERLPYEWVAGARGYRIKDKLHLEYGERFDWPTMDIDPIGDEAFCYGLADHFGILSSGTVVPCCLDSDGNISLGNALTDDLALVLSSERAKNIREGFKQSLAKEELCKRCGYSRRFDIKN